jgi:preprotein translocase subunit SecB
LFPFSRQLLAEITREGGYPPLLINPIDFSPLYQAEVMNRSKAAEPGSSEETPA